MSTRVSNAATSPEPPELSASPAPVAGVQRRTLRVLVVTQVLGGVGVAIGVSVGALLVARIAGGPGLSGLAQSAVAVGGALLAVPVSRLMRGYGRRPGLACGYAVGLLGGLTMIAATGLDSVGLAIVGMFLFGGGTTANLQARYTALDLADPTRRTRQLSLVVWATTVGAVAGPNLAAPADRLARPTGLPTLAGPYAFSVVAFALAALLITVLLRPDPLLLARRLITSDSQRRPEGASEPVVQEPVATGTIPAATGTMGAAIRELRRNQDARLGLSAVTCGYAVMLALMVMTPVHIDAVLGGHHGTGTVSQADVLAVVGLVISLHVAGMYAFSPLVGYASDRYGRRSVVLVGALVLVAACVLAGTAGHDTVWLSVGLFLLGIGWSCTMVAGSTMLTESVPVEVRPSVQGLGDFAMGLAGASAGALAGVILGWVGYPMLAFTTALITVPLMWGAVRVRKGRVEA